ncbi:hypothetical protein [Actinomadura sp. 7K507]|uniref:hypothetical protein n=1 Tax=Actinomadura sp. 7K507 TaxID=2530365 RepID=UPI00104A089F|nr:hypothetical protein [Actinomadura sp. 7K507]TDC93934.1 hypothetical protein E1285_09150 [Actinomadura sp. 7K507]
MNAGEREELERLLPFPVEPGLPEDRARHLKEFVMSEINRDARAGRRRRVARRAALVPVAAAAAMAAPLLLGGGGQAYAITEKGDGTIQITINEAKDPKKLQADLRDRGLNAVVDYIPMGKRCHPQPRSLNFLPREQAPLVAPSTSAGSFRIDPRAVKPGQTAVLEFSIGDAKGTKVAGIWGRVSAAPVADCALADSTEAPLGPPRQN